MIGIKDLYEYLKPKKLLDDIINLIDKFMDKYNLKIDYYLYVDFILHLYMIILDKDNKELNFKQNNSIDEFCEDTPIEYFKNIIQYCFSIELNEYNSEYLESQINLVFFPEKNIVKVYEGEKILFDKVLFSLKNNFGIELDRKVSNIFFKHIQMMLNRVNNNKTINSPLTDMIKKRYYVLFEIALYVSSEIENFYEDIKIDEDEIALIAIHIGNLLPHNLNRYSCAILIPHNVSVVDSIEKLIRNKFSDRLILEDIIVYNKENFGNNYDLLFSIFELDSSFIDKYYLLDIFDMNKNISIIDDAIGELRSEKSINFFDEKMSDLFNEKYFYNNITKKFKDKYEIIEFLANNLIKDKIIEENVYKEVIKRERKSSTAFENFAIPHEFKITAERSIISIIKSSEGLKWDDKEVNLVMLMIFSKNDLKYFREYLTSIYTILDKDIVKEISKKEITYDNFLTVLKLRR